MRKDLWKLLMRPAPLIILKLHAMTDFAMPWVHMAMLEKQPIIGPDNKGVWLF